MTRGKFVLITAGLLISSCEFNVDMGLDNNGHGQDVVNRLLKTKTVEEFKTQVEDFNANTFEYDEDYLNGYQEWRGNYLINEALNLKKDYYRVWGSDYLYIKNADNKAYKLIGLNGTVEIEPGEIVVAYFGTLLGAAIGADDQEGIARNVARMTASYKDDDCDDYDEDDDYDEESYDDDDYEGQRQYEEFKDKQEQLANEGVKPLGKTEDECPAVKAFELLREKHVDIQLIYDCDTVEEYNYRHSGQKLTREEFEFLEKTLTK